MPKEDVGMVLYDESEKNFSGAALWAALSAGWVFLLHFWTDLDE